jgi:hypothetical protein
MVPEAQNAIALSGQVGVSAGIPNQTRRPPVLIAIYLDDQPQAVMREVREIGPDWRLPPKMAGRQLKQSQCIP